MKKIENLLYNENKQPQKPLGSTHTHTHTHTLTFNRNKIKECWKKAFTLAEVLITLAVIGIVAALTIGIFLPKIHSQIRAHQIAIAETKFTKAMEQMALNNAIGPYYDNTQEFVDELQNYLKIAKVCDNEHLEECFGYEKIKLTDGKEFEISDIKKGENLGMDKKYGETVGIVTIDGTGMILSWNKECPIMEPKVYEWGGNTNETTSCVAMLMDVNLDKGPNTQNKDIALFRAESIDSSCNIKFTAGGKTYCLGTFFKPTPLPDAECQARKDELGIKSCMGASYQDYWGGAVSACGGTQNMPDMETLHALGGYLYDTELPHSGRGVNRNVAKFEQYSIPLYNRLYVFSNYEQDSQMILAKVYASNYDGFGDNCACGRFGMEEYAVCQIK